MTYIALPLTHLEGLSVTLTKTGYWRVVGAVNYATNGTTTVTRNGSALYATNTLSGVDSHNSPLTNGVQYLPQLLNKNDVITVVGDGNGSSQLVFCDFIPTDTFPG